MSDVKDVLGFPRAGGGAAEAPAKEKKEKMKRPEGMSREAFALLGDSHPINISHFAKDIKAKDMAKKPKPSTKGIPTYQYRPFKNSARSDDMELFHWIKCYKAPNGVIREPEDTEYPYAKYNKKVTLLKYDDEEYNSLLKADSGAWTQEETDYLLQLCEQFDLRWAVITDRYQYPNPPGPRTMEDLKERYYGVARKLLVAREGGEAPVANHVLVKYPYNKQHEQERKRALNDLLSRTPKQIAEEHAVLAEARVIEERRRNEAGAARRAAPAAAAAATPRTVSPTQGQGVARAAGPVAAAGGAATAAVAPGAAPAVLRELSPAPPLLVSELRHPPEFERAPPRGTPSLFDVEVRQYKPPKPGVFLRGAQMQATAAAQATAMSGGSRAFKAVEQTLSELQYQPAVTGPRIPTRASAGQWLALRSEVVALHELRRNLQNRANADDRGVRRPDKKRKA